jgi:MFS transporter, Spinster family, sphingosine-1-phosphate transporter
MCVWTSARAHMKRINNVSMRRLMNRSVPNNSEIPFPGAKSALTLLLLINLFNYIDRYILAASVGPIKKTFFSGGTSGIATGGDTLDAILHWFQIQLGFKPEDALLGLLGTVFMLVYMIGAPIFARLAEKISRWTIVGWGVILWSLASGFTGIAPTFLVLLLTRCFVGCGEAAYGPVAPAIISDMFPIKIRGRILAWFYVAIPVGSALGYVIGGWISNSNIGEWGFSLFGIWRESWRWVFILVTIPGIALGVKSFFMKELPLSRPGSNRSPIVSAALLREYGILMRNPSYVLCTLGMAAMTFAIGGIAFWMPYYLESRPGAPGNSTIIFGAITAVAGLSATLLGGLAADKLRSRFPSSYFLISGIAMILGFPVFMAALRAPFPWAIWLLMFLTCFCLFFNTGPTNTILANVTRPSMRAAAFALNIFIIHALGDVISPVIIGLLNDRYGDMNKSFLLVGSMFLVAGIFWLLGTRYLERDTDRAAQGLIAPENTE